MFKELTQMDIREYFENVHYSFEMHVRKPEPDIFIQVLDQNGIRARETLLIDDHLPNIETADDLGLKTLHVQLNQSDIKIDV